MSARTVRLFGLVAVALYAALIVWLYARQPRSFTEAAGGVAATLGVYRIDRASFDQGLEFFRRDQFEEARRAFRRADAAEQDPVTQFYIAYAWYRQGWGRVYNDDALFQQGLEAARRAEQAAPGGRVTVDDPDLGMKTSDELIAELERGLTRELSDLNPLRVLRERK